VGELNENAPEWVTCRHSLSSLQDYLDGKLPPDEKASLDLHFRACPPCHDFVRKYVATPGLCQRALARDVPEEVCERLAAFLRKRCGQKP